jgi:DNA invertase Pin-like site-specific DNA recombinase
MMIAAVYVRSARPSEAEMKRQLKRCTDVAGLNCFRVEPTLVFRDFGTGNRVRRHPGFEAMMVALTAGQADALVVEEVSRLSRAVPELLSVLNELAGRGIQVLTADGPAMPILFR